MIVPTLRPGDKDLTDLYRAGGDLRGLITFHLAALSCQRPPEPWTHRPTAICLLEQEIVEGLRAWHEATDRSDPSGAQGIDAATAERIAKLNVLLGLAA